MGNLVCLHSVREDAAVTDGKGMCRIKQRRKQRAGTEEGEEVKKKKNRDRNKVYVSGWRPR